MFYGSDRLYHIPKLELRWQLTFNILYFATSMMFVHVYFANKLDGFKTYDSY